MDPPQRLSLSAGQTAAAKLRVKLATGYHTNSNTPSDEYLIPLRLTWESAPLAVTSIEYPKGQMEKYAFAEKPLSVYTGDFELITHFQAPANAPKGLRTVSGKLRYQACSKNACYPPKTLVVQLPVEVR